MYNAPLFTEALTFPPYRHRLWSGQEQGLHPDVLSRGTRLPSSAIVHARERRCPSAAEPANSTFPAIYALQLGRTLSIRGRFAPFASQGLVMILLAVSGAMDRLTGRTSGIRGGCGLANKLVCAGPGGHPELFRLLLIWHVSHEVPQCAQLRAAVLILGQLTRPRGDGSALRP